MIAIEVKSPIIFLFPSISRHVLWGSPCSNDVPGCHAIGLEKEQWIQTSPLRSSRDSHTRVLPNSIVVQRWAIVSPPIRELLFWPFG
jgi:hypothetical protein